MKIHIEKIFRNIKNGSRKPFFIIATTEDKPDAAGVVSITLEAFKYAEDGLTLGDAETLDYTEYTEERRTLLLQLFREIDDMTEECYDGLTVNHGLIASMDAVKKGGKDMKQIDGDKWFKDVWTNNLRADINFTVEGRELAENLIHEIALETERTYEENGEGDTHWLSIVNHSADNWSVTVYFEAEKPQDEPDEFEHLKTDREIPVFDPDEAMKYFTGNVGPSFKTEIPEEPCRGSLDVGHPPTAAYSDKEKEKKKGLRLGVMLDEFRNIPADTLSDRDSVDALAYSAKRMANEEERKQKSFKQFLIEEEIDAYHRYCSMTFRAGESPANFDEFKKWARQVDMEQYKKWERRI